MKVAVGLILLALAVNGMPHSAAVEDTNAFAAPEIVMIHGGSLQERVVIADWKENLRLMSGLVPQSSVPDSALRDRPFFDVALFWHVGWRAYSEVPDSLCRLQPHQGNQFARLYPAFRNEPPLLVFQFGLALGLPGPPYRSVNKDALELLAKHGVRLGIGRK